MTVDITIVHLVTGHFAPLPFLRHRHVSIGHTKVINALYVDENGHDVCLIIYLPTRRLITILLQQNLIAYDEQRFLWKPIIVGKYLD